MMALVEDLRAHVSKDDLSSQEVAGHVLLTIELFLFAAMVFGRSKATAGLLPPDIAFSISQSAIIAYAALNCTLILCVLAMGEMS
ncbi:hypothetical protein [Halogeometricum limi]|uniref:Uncharacterized protein n=1 Tax=Halogeometricum limi TaxID=555875 RepID=A0A1I6FW38_9EURY|nr:hypothetical protein [Halogeometricum limi]SFR34118.1 hypothetical protein SAMN04488124_0408 [Halogeometricum limi]